MRSIESSAKTMEEAVTQGLEKLGVSLGDVTIDILSEGSKGFFGLLGGKPVVVKLTVREGVEEDSAFSPFSLDEAADNQSGGRKKGGKRRQAKDKADGSMPEAESKPLHKKERASASKVGASGAREGAQMPSTQMTGAQMSGVPVAAAPVCDPGTPEGKAQRFLLRVTELMGVNVSVAVKRDAEGNVRVDMHGDILGILIGRRGETLDALQYLTSLTVNRDQEDYVRVTLDTENYRAKREEQLTRLANRMASRVVKTGRKVVFEPMNPYERRILHSALQQNASVTTHSEGEEPNRHVVITLK